MSESPVVAAMAQLEPAWQRDAWPDVLTTAWNEARTRWPRVRLAPDVFAEHLVPRLAAGDEPPPPQAIVELYLACACAQGDSAAIEAFEHAYHDAMGSAARGASDARRAEFRQYLRHKLFVGQGAKISEYNGRGSLEGWARVTARRAFLDLERGIGRRRDGPGDGALLDQLGGQDLELDFLKRHYRERFRSAFGQALQALDVRHRNVLRQHMVHRLSIDELGALYDVHRATAARWVQRARQALLVGTRQTMQATLRVEDEELDSIMRLIDSRLDVSVVRVLGTSDPDSDSGPGSDRGG